MAITTWTTITAGDDSAEAPFRTRHASALRQRLMHCQEFVYDRDTHTPHEDQPHDHCGVCSPRLPSTAVPNLILDGIGVRGWTLSGATQGASTGISFSGTGQSARKRILNASGSGSTDQAATRQVFGTGCPLTVAVVARTVGTVSAVNLLFGLGDASTPKAGAYVTVTQAELSSSWKRFYFYHSSFSASTHFTDTSFLVWTSGTWTGAGTVEVTLAYLRPGNGLSFWVPGHMESNHVGGAGLQGGPASLYDQDRDFVNATELTP